MTDLSQGPGWWLASDGKWYPPESVPPPPPPPPSSTSFPPPLGYEPQPSRSSDRTNGTAVAAMVFAFVFWPVGIILGHVARSSVRKTGEKGGGLALAALIISYVWGGVVVAIIVIAVAASNSPTGFNDLGTLQGSVSQQVGSNLHNPSNAGYSPGTSVTSTLCVHNSGTQYSCVVTLSDGTKVPVSVTVSTDGSRWVSNG
jgi:hypothetical protein